MTETDVIHYFTYLMLLFGMGVGLTVFVLQNDDARAGAMCVSALTIFAAAVFKYVVW